MTHMMMLFFAVPLTTHLIIEETSVVPTESVSSRQNRQVPIKVLVHHQVPGLLFKKTQTHQHLAAMVWSATHPKPKLVLRLKQS